MGARLPAFEADAAAAEDLFYFLRGDTPKPPAHFRSGTKMVLKAGAAKKTASQKLLGTGGMGNPSKPPPCPDKSFAGWRLAFCNSTRMALKPGQGCCNKTR